MEVGVHRKIGRQKQVERCNTKQHEGERTTKRRCTRPENFKSSLFSIKRTGFYHYLGIYHYLGSGHFPLSLSSATNFCMTSRHRCSNAVTASLVIAPSSSVLPPVCCCMMNENWRSVSKHAFANSSRSFRLDSVSAETVEPDICTQLIHCLKSEFNFDY